MPELRAPIKRLVVVADDDGVIIIPAAQAQRTIIAGEARAAKEAEMMRKIAQGTSTLELMGLAKWRERA